MLPVFLHLGLLLLAAACEALAVMAPRKLCIVWSNAARPFNFFFITFLNARRPWPTPHADAGFSPPLQSLRPC